MMMNHRYILFTGLMVTALCIHAQDIELQTKRKIRVRRCYPVMETYPESCRALFGYADQPGNQLFRILSSARHTLSGSGR